MHADLESLLALQEHDKAIMGIEGELAAFTPELEALDAELAKAQAERDAAAEGHTVGQVEADPTAGANPSRLYTAE